MTGMVLFLVMLVVELVTFYASEEFLSYASWIGDAGGLETFTGVFYFHGIYKYYILLLYIRSIMIY